MNVSQLPFYALTVYFFWRGLNFNKKTDWLYLGVFSALGFLSKYLFVYLLLSLFIFFILNFKTYKKLLKNYLLSIFFSLIILTPHFVWLFKNNFITIFYGLKRTGLSEVYLINHFTNPIIFLFKQLIILIPFLLWVLFY